MWNRIKTAFQNTLEALARRFVRVVIVHRVVFVPRPRPLTVSRPRCSVEAAAAFGQLSLF